MAATETWLYVNDQGKIIEHTENDGPGYLRKGPESLDRVVELDHVERSYSRSIYQQILKELEEWHGCE